ncbi:MAG: type I glyceraldehyde-3-phosphate dehydrogenase [Candidatus Peregrinibacteria bacterium]
MIRVGLNGYGRIGRLAHRRMLNHPDLEVAAINARSEDAAMRAHLLKYDSIHGRMDNQFGYDDKNIIIDGKKIRCFAVKDASEIPWPEVGVDVVIECTGKAKTYDIAAKHLTAGAKKVVVSAPMKDDTPTFVLGVNEKDLKPEHHVISNASCTTNCIAAPIKLLHEKWGVLNVSASSIHAVTHSQNLLDNSGRDLRRARSALMSIIPTTTGAVSVIGKLLPELDGKMDGIAYRVPVLNSSIVDMVVHLEKEVTKDEVNDFFRGIAKDPYYDPIIDVTEESLVSIDFRGNPHSSIIDVGLTQVMNGHYVKLFLWYDNEWGYVNRLVDMTGLMAKQLG